MRYKKIIELLPACALLSLLLSANSACSSGQASNKQEESSRNRYDNRFRITHNPHNAEYSGIACRLSGASLLG